MKLLILTHNPNRASFSQRVSVYIDILTAEGIDCHIELLPSGIVHRYKLYRRCADYDAVFLHKKQLNILDAYWLRKFGRKIIYNYDDAVMFSDKHPERLNGRHWRGWKRSVKTADRVLAGSDYLADFARPFHRNVQILPIGLRIADYKMREDAGGEGRIRLVWIGSASTLGYLELIRPALETIGKRYPNVLLRMICDEFTDIAGMQIEKMKWSPQARMEGLASSDIGLAPLPGNRFTQGKCSFKVLEYGASGLPVVASPVGTNSQHIIHGTTGYLAHTENEWLTALGGLIEDATLRKEMGRAGRKNAEQYDIAVIGKKLATLLKEGIMEAI